MKKIIKENTGENKGSPVWRIIFGILFIIFALFSLGRFNATAALLYVIISIFIFIPGRKFKINSKWIKITIVIVSVLIVGLINHFTINTTVPVIEEYTLGQEFLLPNDSNFALTITKAIKEPKIMVKEQEYTTDGSFLLVYINTRFAGDLSTLSAENMIPFSMSFILKDSNNNEYYNSDINTAGMAQTQSLEPGESFYLFNIPKTATGLNLIFTAKDVKKLVVVHLDDI